MASIIIIHVTFTDQVVSVGNVRRVYYHSLVELDDQTKRWLYFGTDPTDPGVGPSTGDPVYEYAYVQFPQAFDDMGQEGIDALFEMGMIAGYRREGYKDS